MKVTYNWLKDFVEIRLAPQALAERLTMAGLEVTSLEERAGDFIFEIEVTSNRPDWLSVIGVAREVAAITGKKLKVPEIKKQNSIKGKSTLEIKIEDRRGCPLYTAKIIRGIKVGPSPDWLRKRLELVGCRSVNNIVDITNYILFVWGEPLHAFDADKLRGDTIFIRRAKDGEKITTIDGENRILDSDILVIADEKNPVAVAGVIGGKESEVSYATKNILLEAAVFNPILIRRARQRLGTQTDSSYRFERGVDTQIVEKASSHVAQLIEELAGGNLVLAKSSGITRAKARAVSLELPWVSQILGTDIKGPQIKKILANLGFKSKGKGKNSLKVEIPSHRQDVALEVDLIEEVARIYGYENIPTTLPAARPEVRGLQSRDVVLKIKKALIGLGSNEVITYSLVDKDLLDSSLSQIAQQGIEISNPLSKEQGMLRPQLIPSLVKCLAYNLNQKQEYVNIFEISSVFLNAQAAPKEELKLGIALCGTKPLLLEQGLVRDAAGLLHLKGILEVLFTRLGIKDYTFSQDRSSEITVAIGREKIGILSQVTSQALDKVGVKNKEAFVAEVSLEKLLSCADSQRRFIPLPLYPAISRDISLVLPEGIAVGDVLQELKEKGRPLLKEAKVADYYKGKQIPAGFKGLTISCVYRSDERTLKEAEISPIHSSLCSMLKDNFRAEIR